MFLRVILSSSTFSSMLITTRYQVDQGKWPRVIFKQLPLVQTHQRCKGKESLFVQLPENIPEALFDPSSGLIELSTPLASPHLNMNMDFTMAPQKNNRSGEYYIDLLSGDPAHENRETSPHIKDRYLDVYQMAKKGKNYTYQEDKSQYDEKISEPSRARVNATFTGT